MSDRPSSHPTEILIASDLSAHSDRALERALKLAEAWKARLVVAHVLEAEPQDPEAVTARIMSELPHSVADAELVVRVGSAPTVLATLAGERGSGLIVTGAGQFNSLGDYATGTAVDHIVRKASEPVLVVRARAMGSYDPIIVATDFSERSRAALHAAASFFPASQLVLAHAYAPAPTGRYGSVEAVDYLHAEALGLMTKFLSSTVLPQSARALVDPVVGAGTPLRVIKQQVKMTGATLVVVGAHGNQGFLHSVLGSQAQAILEGIETDVLLVT